MVDIATQITLHFQSTGPTLESKHRLPVEPEIRVPEGLRQNIRYLLVLQILFRGHEQFGQRQSRILVQLELLVGVCVFTAVDGGTTEGIVGIVLVKPVIFVQYRNARSLNGRNIPECVPHDLKMVVHLTATPHKEAFGNVLATIATTAGKLQLFK